MQALLSAVLAALVLVVPRLALAEVPTGQPLDGIRCDRLEGTLFHIHQHLTIVAHGRPVPIPDDVGRPVLAQCIYWLHTHTPDGIIHVESPVFRSFTLGQFFAIWGQPLTPTDVAGVRTKRGAVRAYLDGHRYEGDPRTIPLSEHADIVLELGPPYATPAPFTDWGVN
ncbi:MAG: hypothetical protein ACREM2_03090 [Vulcanimicrobiaceae bacterium]